VHKSKYNITNNTKLMRGICPFSGLRISDATRERQLIRSRAISPEGEVVN
jgi:hypothetical protein